MTSSAWGYAGLFLWASGIMLGLQWYSQQHLSEFDPAFLLQSAASASDFDRTLHAALVDAGVEGASLVHFESSSPCYCNQLSQPHYEVLRQRLGEVGYQHRRINIDEHPALAAIIPSVPALAVVDAAQQLRYLGPYAMGYGCFTGKTLVAKIESLSIADSLVGTAIETDIEGCFCQSGLYTLALTASGKF